ncbi:MAG: peptidoglycan DD-metalloendopeptidase family protein [Sporichthyaceae bacterium]
MRRLLGRTALAVAVTLAALGPAAASHADEPTPAPSAPARAIADQEQIDAVLAEVRGELAESSEAMVRAYADLRLADQALPTARETAARTRTLLAAAKVRQEQTARARGAAQVRYMVGNQEAETQATAVAAQQARVGRLARAIYQGGSAFGNVSVLLEARSPSDFAERLVALRAVASSQRSALTNLQAVQDTYGARTDDLAQVRDTLAAADEQAQRDLVTVSQLAQEATAAEARVGALVSARQAALAAAAQAQVQEDVAHAQQTGTSTQLQNQLAAVAQRDLGGAGSRDGATVPARQGTLGWPARGPVTSPFGMRVHPVTGVYKLHTGTDLGVPCGTPVHASLPGTVIEAGWNSAYGWRSVITHGAVDGVLLTTTYNHQTHLDVTVGDQVAAGQVIGTSGTTGFSTGCHLHFELYVNSTLVDPEPWLPAH